jgi:hypothetical protein
MEHENTTDVWKAGNQCNQLKEDPTITCQTFIINKNADIILKGP